MSRPSSSGSGPRWLRSLLLTVLVALGTVGVAALLTVVLPPGTVVAGQRVTTAAGARDAAISAADAVTGQRMRVETAVGTAVELTVGDLSPTVDVDATVEPVVATGAWQIWGERVTGNRVRLPLVVDVPDSDRLAALADELDLAPTDAELRVTATGVETSPPAEGIDVTASDVARAVRRAVAGLTRTEPADWPDVLEVAVDTPPQRPAIDQADLDAAVDAVTALTDSPVDVRARVPVPPDPEAETEDEDEDAAPGEGPTEEVTITLTPVDLRGMVSVTPTPDAPPGERLDVGLSAESPAGPLAALLRSATRTPRLDAHIEDRSPTPRPGPDEELADVSEVTGRVVVDGVGAGFVPDREATVAAIEEAARSDSPEAVEVVGQDVADITPEELGIVEPISTYTTFYPAGQSRVQNIHRIAEIVDGTVILPGESYELNHAVGPRTYDNGFTLGGAILDGELVSDVGGGVSQFATTFFNAAWFAGIELVEWKPHSYYFSRYPAGREATINYPNVNLEVRNDTPTAILVDTEVTSDSVTVTFWGTPYWEVETITGPRSGGGASFRITVDRIRTSPSGESHHESWTTVYAPPP